MAAEYLEVPKKVSFTAIITIGVMVILFLFIIVPIVVFGQEKSKNMNIPKEQYPCNNCYVSNQFYNKEPVPCPKSTPSRINRTRNIVNRCKGLDIYDILM